MPIRVVIVGTGFGGTYALKYLHKEFCGNKKNKRNVEISLVSENNYFLFTPLLHEVATGGVNYENVLEPICQELRCCLDNFYPGQVKYISIKEKFIETQDSKIFYDYLILAPGAETNFYGIPGAEEHSLTLKSIEDAVRIKNQLVSDLKQTTVVVGGGPSGVELAAELREFLDKEARIILIQKGESLMPQFSKKIREKSLKVLQKKGIEVKLASKTHEVGPDYILLESGQKIQSQNIIWVAGIKPTNLKFDVEVTKSPNGKLLVNKYLQLENYPEVFAVGDVAAFRKDDSYLPALAQVASKEGKRAAKNIIRLIKNKTLKPFHYHHSGVLVSLGQWMAVGEIKGFFISGRFTWWLWRTVYLFKVVSWKKKLKIARDWSVNLFHPRDKHQIQNIKFP